MPKNTPAIDDETRLLIVNHNYFIRSVIVKLASLGAMTMTIGLLCAAILAWYLSIISKAAEAAASTSKTPTKVDSSYLLAGFLVCIVIALIILYVIRFYMVVSEIKKLHQKVTNVEVSTTKESDSNK